MFVINLKDEVMKCSLMAGVSKIFPWKTNFHYCQEVRLWMQDRYHYWNDYTNGISNFHSRIDSWFLILFPFHQILGRKLIQPTIPKCQSFMSWQKDPKKTTFHTFKGSEYFLCFCGRHWQEWLGHSSSWSTTLNWQSLTQSHLIFSAITPSLHLQEATPCLRV